MLGFVEVPQGKSSLPTFYIARWPVTVAQYRMFVREARHDAGKDWERGLSNHPVVHVNAFDAECYCAWLTAQFRANRDAVPARFRHLIEQGWVIHLPSDDEWLWAAVGDTGWEYPWGNEAADTERANIDMAVSVAPRAFPLTLGSVGKSMSHTTPVGCFPRGRSWCGAEEMSGIVWEWTSTASADGSSRVLHGATFYGDAWRLRSGLFDFRGFRVAVSPFRTRSSDL